MLIFNWKIQWISNSSFLLKWTLLHCCYPRVHSHRCRCHFNCICCYCILLLCLAVEAFLFFTTRTWAFPTPQYVGKNTKEHLHKFSWCQKHHREERWKYYVRKAFSDVLKGWRRDRLILDAVHADTWLMSAMDKARLLFCAFRIR